MIRLIQRRLIIPRGDTGSFSIPVLSKGGTDNIAVFTIFDETTRTKMFQKIISGEGDVLTIAFTHSDTVNLKPGKYVWDIKYYKNPEYIDDELVNGEEIDSYYAGFSLPVCEIRETADNYLVSPEAPTATLSPEQLEIVTGAIHSLNEAIRKTQENVEHYPEIRDDVWYAWDAELGDYVSTGVSANGIVGNGIASAVLNNDYTLTLNFTDGTSFTSPSIRGETGNGIDDIVLNNNFTLTISYTDGGSYTTPSIRGPIGPTPQFSIGTVQDGAVAAASITGTAENPVLNLTLPNAHVPTRVSQLENDAGYLTQHQDLSDYVQKTDYATKNSAGVVKINGNNGIVMLNNELAITGANETIIKQGTDIFRPLVSNRQHASTFYGLAKAAGDTTQSQSSNAVGTYTNEAKAAIQTMLDVPSNGEMNTAIGTAIGQINSFDIAVVQALPTQDISTHTIYLVPKTGETNDVYDEYVYINNNWEMVGNTQIDLSDYALKSELPDVPVQDVQIDGTSILNVQGVANVPVATSSGNYGVVKINTNYGIASYNNDGTLMVMPSSSELIKTGSNGFRPIVAARQHESAFYGLAKAAGDSTQSVSENAVGTYTDEAKAAIQQMLDVPNKAALDTKAPVIYKTVTGSSLTITDAIPNLPLKSLILTITGDPTDVGTTSASVVVSPSTTAAEGTTYTKSFDAIYEGTLDFISGKLTITKAILDLGSIGYNYNNDYHYFFSQALYGIIDTNEPIYSSDLTVVTPEEIQAGTEGVAFGGATYIYVYNNNYVGMTIDEFKAAVAGKCIAYSLRTPRVVQLSAEDIRALSGTTYISSEDGNLNVEYLVDTKSYIDAGIENIDLSGFATKADTVLETTLSRGRKEGSTVGTGSIAFGFTTEASGNYSQAFGSNACASGGGSYANGINIIASGNYSHAEGNQTTSSGNYSHAEGYKNIASGSAAHAEGYQTISSSTGTHSEGKSTIASGQYAHAEGNGSVANGMRSHAEGYNTITLASDSHASGKYNVVDSYSSWPEWTTGTSYVIGDKVKVTTVANDQTIVVGYICKTDNADVEFTVANWNIDYAMNYVDIVGNGTADDARSNAYALDWDGNGHFAGDVYVGANADSTGGTKLVKDVQVAGTSVTSNGVASIPVGSNDNFGVYKTGSYGITVMNMPGYEGTLAISSAASSEIKASNGLFKVITPSSQHRSVFYGLAKAAGDSTQSVSENAVGTYTDEAKAAIQQMLDVPSTNDIPVESGTGVGSVKTKPYILDNAIENNLALGIGSFAVGASAVAIGNGSFAAADSFAKGTLSHAEGYHLFLNISISGEENSTEYSFESTSNLAIDDYLVSFDRSLVAQITSVDNENKMIVISQTFGDICDNLPIAVYRTGAFGNQSHAEGVRTLASNQAAHAEGRTTIAKGIASHAEGRSSEANGSYSHAEGYGTNANGNYSHAEGTYTWATGTYSHVEGHRSYALGSCAHAEGNHGNAWYIYLTNGNSENEYLFTIVAENVIAKPGDIIDLNGVIRFITSVTDQTLTLQNAFEEPCDNTQAVLYTSGAFGAGSHVEGHSTIAQGMYQHVQGKYNVSDNEGVYADIVGNGSNDLNHSNAYVLTWTGDGKYAGDVYVHANADSTGGTKLATIEDIPDAPVQDVQVNGVSVLGQDGVANVPVATYDTLGTIKLSPTGQTSSGAYGLHIENGALMIVSAAENIIKAGTDSFRPITAKRIGAAAFYGLSKVAGVDLANETVTLGTYPETSKTAIKAMLGVQDGLKVVRLI